MEGDINFGRHFALDGSFSWFPKNTIGNNAMTGLFGVKAGTRTEHFGFFAKVRPGFLTFDNALREETILVTPGLSASPLSLYLHCVLAGSPSRRSIWAAWWNTIPRVIGRSGGIWAIR